MADISCRVVASREALQFKWHFGDSDALYRLRGTCLDNFRKLSAQARKRLDFLADDCWKLENLLDEVTQPRALIIQTSQGANASSAPTTGLPQETSDRTHADLEQRVRRDSYELARIGHKLYRQAFLLELTDTSESANAKIVLDRLASEPDPERYLKLGVEGRCSVPWNVLYDQDPDENAFLSGGASRDRWSPFWGMRYYLAAGPSVPVTQQSLPPDVRVVMVIDRKTFDQLPGTQQDEFRTFCSEHSYPEVNTLKDLKRHLKEHKPRFLYWLAHGTPKSLDLGTDQVTPEDLQRLLRGDEYEGRPRFGGLAFLNACYTGALTKSNSSFLIALNQAGWSGMVGTEVETVSTIAARFGMEFLRKFLLEGEPVGRLLHTLRYGEIPLGLLYTAACPAGLRIPRPPRVGQP